jgi:hypothetical protein
LQSVSFLNSSDVASFISKEPPVKTGGILEFKQSLPAVFFALHLNIFPYC